MARALVNRSPKAPRAALAVVIPTLDEAANLPELLADLAAQRGLHLEVIVADGGSQDDTAALARRAGATVITSARGRAKQMNAGASASRAPWLLFLHADSRLLAPDQLAQALAAMQAVPDRDAVGGHWPLHFHRNAASRDGLLRYMEGKSSSNRPGTINGDQGLLLARRFFQQLGGFDESLPFFEDQRLAAQVFTHGRWLLLPGRLRTSARRFESEGYAVRYALMAIIVGAHVGGLHDFLAGLPALYRTQTDTSPLRLRRFLDALDLALDDLQADQRRALWQQVGVLVRDNTWQLAHALDVWRSHPQPIALRRYDRLLGGIARQPAAATFAALVTRSVIAAATRYARITDAH